MRIIKSLSITVLGLFSVCCTMQCKGTHGDTPAKTGTETQTETQAETAEITEAQKIYYQTGFAEADSFKVLPIKKEFLRPLDRANNTYLEVFDGNKKLIGYLRDFMGPVTADAGCECAPLNMTLAFNPDYSLKTIFSASPLTKYGHELMSDKDMERLIEIAKNPPASFQEVTNPKQMVDATTSATKLEYRSDVVGMAAFSSWRVAGVVQETAAILQRIPIQHGFDKLEKILKSTVGPQEKMTHIVSFMKGQSNETVAHQSLQQLMYLYVQHLQAQGAAIAAVEEMILTPITDDVIGIQEINYACYVLAAQKLRLDFVEQCVQKIEASPFAEQLKLMADLLKGTLLFERGKHAEALPLLAPAQQYINFMDDPDLFLRLATAYAKTGDSKTGCLYAKTVYMAHPKKPGTQDHLKFCVDEQTSMESVIQELQTEQRKQLMKRRVDSPAPVAPLHVSTTELTDVTVDLTKDNKVTVLVFFATWCPHCQKELPKLIEFAAKLQKDPKLKDSVQVIGVRTSVEREVEDYQTFMARFKPNFPIYTDATLSLVFGKFTRDHNVKQALPTLAVIDTKGHARYFIVNSEHGDLNQDLTWAVESLLP